MDLLVTDAPLATLLDALGRRPDELITICHQASGATGGLPFQHCRVDEAQTVVDRLSGEANVWFTAQPMDVASFSAGSRGGKKDVTGMVTLFVDLDYYDAAHKPTGCTKDQAALIMRDLSDILGRSPAAVVLSGHGAQPYWPTERMSALSGAILTLRWKQLVLRVAEAHGAQVDKGVFELARILRVPGPPNLKYGESAPTRLVLGPESSPLTETELTAILDAHLPVEMSSAHDGPIREREDDGDRIFTTEQAVAFMAPQFAAIRDTPWSSGADYWMVLWSAAGLIASFDTMFEESDLRSMIYQAISDGHDGARPDAADEYQIDRAFCTGWSWKARRPTAAEQSDPFSPHCTIEPRLATEPSGASEYKLVEPDGRVSTTAAPDDPFAPYVPGVAREVPTAEQAVATQGRHLHAVRASGITPESCDWLWEHDGEFWIPLGGLVLLGGREGAGKSTWTARLVAQITNGKMKGEFLGQPRSVIISATEDAWPQTIIPRLMAAGADLDRVIRVDVIDGEVTSGMSLPHDVPALRKLILNEDVAMVVLDPLLSTIGGNGRELDTHKDSDVRKALEPISLVAAESRATFLGLIHQNKSTGGDMATRLMGSRAFAAVARAVLVCAEDDAVEDSAAMLDLDDDGAEALPAVPPASAVAKTRRFLFGQIKNNLGPKVQTSVRYELVGHVVGNDEKTGKPIRTSRVQILKDEHGNYVKADYIEDAVTSTERAVATKVDGRRKPEGESVQDKCNAWLMSVLSVSPRPSREVKAIGAVQGHLPAAIQRASKALGVTMTGEYHNPTWSLPEKEPVVA